MTRSNLIVVWLSSLSATLMLSSSAAAQLQITEIMYNPISSGDSAWEWIEVQNLGGADVDLNGAFLDRLGDPQITSLIPNISNANATNTIIPAGGVAVIYDGFNSGGSPANYNDQVFRDAWGLDSSVPLIAADLFPALVNSGGRSIGIWADKTAYDLDIDASDPGNPVVGSFNNALTGVAFGHTAPWPSGGSSNGFSIKWSGNGLNSDGAEWAFSEVGSRGAVLSVPAAVQGELINNSADYANPDDVFTSATVTGTIATGLYITEIMYNPASVDTTWEWVEVYNNTGSALDFGSTPYVLHDDDGANLTAANLTSGMIPDQGIAVFYSNALTQEQVEAAWGQSINFIPVENLPALGNSGDLVAIWPSLAAYQMEVDPLPESSASPTRTTDHAIAQVLYSDGADGFPAENGMSSIYVSSFTTADGPQTGDHNVDGVVDAADYAFWRDRIGTQQGYEDWRNNFGASGGDGTTTLTWALDTPPLGNSFSPNQVLGEVAIHPGGDVASPGTFVPVVSGSSNAVPEPAGALLMLLGAAIAAVKWRR